MIAIWLLLAVANTMAWLLPARADKLGWGLRVRPSDAHRVHLAQESLWDYPLAVVLTIAAVRRDDRARLSGIVLALGGAAVSVWHVLIEHYPSLSSSSTCDPTNPCSIRWVEEFGFLTIPTMALIGFLTITTLLLLPHPPDDDPALEASA